MKFVGIDFGWRSQPSGLCCLDWQANQLHLVALQRLTEMDDILVWVEGAIAPGESGVIAVDAPTLIPNATGMRLPDRLTHRYFGRYHAGSYPANLGSPFAQRTLELGLQLEERGFVHAPVIQPQQPGRFQIEVFPHPAIVHLFQLDRILKYKKGKVGDRRPELARLRHYILTCLPTLEPSLSIHPDQLPDIPQTGTALKALEDQLDSLICAYVAAHWWYWGLERNWVLGGTDADPPDFYATGYIVVPASLPQEEKLMVSPANYLD